MNTIAAIAATAVLFAAFVYFRPAERSKPCRGKTPWQEPCKRCQLGDGEQARKGRWKGCPGEPGPSH